MDQCHKLAVLDRLQGLQTSASASQVIPLSPGILPVNKKYKLYNGYIHV